MTTVITPTPHLLTVVVDEAGVHEYRVDCPGLDNGQCHSYITCEDSQCDEDALDKLADEGDDEPELHGVTHYRNDGEWMRRIGECFVATHQDLVAAARDMDAAHSAGDLAAGSYRVVSDPQDHPTELVLELARTA